MLGWGCKGKIIPRKHHICIKFADNRRSSATPNTNQFPPAFPQQILGVFHRKYIRIPRISEAGPPFFCGSGLFSRASTAPAPTLKAECKQKKFLHKIPVFCIIELMIDLFTLCIQYNFQILKHFGLENFYVRSRSQIRPVRAVAPAPGKKCGSGSATQPRII